MDYLNDRVAETKKKFLRLQNEVAHLNNLLEGKACIYATGSFGRLDAGSKSDLDLFIVTKVATQIDGEDKRIVNLLSNLDVIITKARLIEAVRKIGLPDFDSDGKYLECHSIHDMTDKMGGREDDYSNLLTGRLLMFLEGRPLIQDAVFHDIIDEVTAAYFKDFGDFSEKFLPAYLMNDILRLWRTFCVNYEFSRKTAVNSKAKAKIKNFKLKHSRMLTCFSAICFIAHRFKLNRTVTTDDIKQMTRLTPLERIGAVADAVDDKSVHDLHGKLRLGYTEFLRLTDLPDEQLEKEIQENWKSLAIKSYGFGDDLYDFLEAVGGKTKLMRLVSI